MCVQLYTRLNKYLLNYRSINYSKLINTMKPLEDTYQEFSPWQVYFLWLKHQREIFIQVGFTQYLLAWVRCGCLSKSGHVNLGSLKERDAYWNPVKCIYPCGEIHADYTTFLLLQNFESWTEKSYLLISKFGPGTRPVTSQAVMIWAVLWLTLDGETEAQSIYPKSHSRQGSE